jgi:large subunit ribosomal protein L30e
MAKKITTTELRKIVKAGNTILGTERTIKNLKLGKVQKVLVSSNCPANVEKSIGYYAGLSNAEFYKLNYPNDELSVICKKPFSISVLAVLRSAGK